MSGTCGVVRWRGDWRDTGNRSSSIHTLVVRNVSIISIMLTRKWKNFLGICSISKNNAIFCTFLIHKRKIANCGTCSLEFKYLCRTFRTSARKVAQCWNKRPKLRRPSLVTLIVTLAKLLFFSYFVCSTQRDVRVMLCRHSCLHVSQNLAGCLSSAQKKNEMSQHPRAKHIYGRNFQLRCMVFLG